MSKKQKQQKNDGKGKHDFKIGIGSDPECFLFDNEENRIVSAIPVLKRDKYDPIDFGGGYKMYYDNAQVEFTIPPSYSKSEFINTFKSAFGKMDEYLKGNFGDRYKLVAQASHTFDDEQLTHEQSKVIGVRARIQL